MGLLKSRSSIVTQAHTVYPKSLVPRHDALFASTLLNLSSRNCQVELTAEKASMEDSQDESTSKNYISPSLKEGGKIDENNNATVLILISVAHSDWNDLSKGRIPAKRPKPSKVPRRQSQLMRSLHEIVMPTLEEGHNLLPVSGGWKFFPSPEFRQTRKLILEGKQEDGNSSLSRYRLRQIQFW